MSDETRTVGDFDLMAYADGRLDPHRRREVEAWLAKCPEDAERVRQDAAIIEAIRQLYAPSMSEPVPARLDAALHGRGRRPWRRMVRHSAMAASLMGAGIVGWWAGGQSQIPAAMAVDQRLLGQVTAAYREGMSPVSPASADGLNADDMTSLTGLSSGAVTSQPVTSLPVTSLNERMTFEAQAPDLTVLGFTMVGQRVARTPQGDVVEVNYADRTGSRLALFLTTRWQESQPSFRATRHNDVSTAWWYDGPLAVALAGEAEPEVIRDLGISVHELMKADGVSSPALSPPAAPPAPVSPHPSPSLSPPSGVIAPFAGDAGADGFPGGGLTAGQTVDIPAPGSLILPGPVAAPGAVQQADHEM